jgi:hypothetical protein
VAADSRADGIDRDPMHTLYQPDTQVGAQSTLLVRTAGAADALVPQVIETIRGLDPNRPIDHVRTLEDCENITAQSIAVPVGETFTLIPVIISGVMCRQNRCIFCLGRWSAIGKTKSQRRFRQRKAIFVITNNNMRPLELSPNSFRSPINRIYNSCRKMIHHE